ncbi:MAG: nucleotidyltransferase family protein [Planctomycetota bacterium]
MPDQSHDHPPLVGIIPAAGQSTRMGKPKQLMMLGERTLLESTLESLRAPCAVTIVVVHAGIASNARSSKRVEVIQNDDPASGMIDSIRLAMDHADAGMPRIGGWMVVPGDLPGLTSNEITPCIDAFRAHPESIIIAAHQGRHGHPMIIPASMTSDIRSSACDNGLRDLKVLHRDRLHIVDCPSAAVLRNINTPSDYERLRREHARDTNTR